MPCIKVQEDWTGVLALFHCAVAAMEYPVQRVNLVVRFVIGVICAEKTLEFYPSLLQDEDIIIPLTKLFGVHFGDSD